MQESKKLVRSSTDTMIAGVCSGLAQYFSVDPVLGAPDICCAGTGQWAGRCAVHRDVDHRS